MRKSSRATAFIEGQMHITITVDQSNGQVNLTTDIPGGLQNKVMLYGILEVAHDIVVDWNQKNEQRVQVVPALQVPKFDK